MSLYDNVFPKKQHPDLVQTQWSKGWVYAIMGFAGAAEHLTEHRSKFGATIDSVGLAIFYLQRHRVELLLKHFLQEMTGKPGEGHDLETLWQQCEMRIQPLDPKAWKGFAKDQRPIVDLFHRVDSTSTAFRYPQEKDGTPAARPDYIDLDALNAAVEEFDGQITGYIDWWWELQSARP